MANSQRLTTVSTFPQKLSDTQTPLRATTTDSRSGCVGITLEWSGLATLHTHTHTHGVQTLHSHTHTRTHTSQILYILSSVVLKQLAAPSYRDQTEAVTRLSRALTSLCRLIAALSRQEKYNTNKEKHKTKSPKYSTSIVSFSLSQLVIWFLLASPRMWVVSPHSALCLLGEKKKETNPGAGWMQLVGHLSSFEITTGKRLLLPWRRYLAIYLLASSQFIRKLKINCTHYLCANSYFVLF